MEIGPASFHLITYAMNHSPEQQSIINTSLHLGQSLLVSAGAGTGKTTCLIEFSKKNPDKKILYLGFNNKTVHEAKKNYFDAQLTNTTCSTIHGLANQTKSFYEGRNKFRKKIHLQEIQAHLNCTLPQALLAQLTLKAFCQSALPNILAEHIPSDVPLREDPTYILNLANTLWKDMVNPAKPLPLSYDEYLKIYALNALPLNFDYILLDEAQDSNPISLFILEKAKLNTRILLIGDPNQAIYGWRGAKNAMATWDFSFQKTLSQSFRFGPNIAKLANFLLKNFPQKPPSIHGLGSPDYVGKINTEKAYTLIARTNSTLFAAALNCIENNKKIHFTGTKIEKDWNPSEPYRFQETLDVFHLWANQKEKISCPQIKLYKSYSELKSATQKKEHNQNVDVEIQSLCRLVEKYGHRLPNLLNQISAHSTEPSVAEVILSTAHRAKGLEWDTVVLADDFSPLASLKYEHASQTRSLAQTDAQIEEFNLIYVAITRAKKHLQPNQDILKLLNSPIFSHQPPPTKQTLSLSTLSNKKKVESKRLTHPTSLFIDRLP